MAEREEGADEGVIGRGGGGGWVEEMGGGGEVGGGGGGEEGVEVVTVAG